MGGPKCERLEKQPALTQEPQKEAEESNVQVDEPKRKEEVAKAQVQESPAAKAEPRACQRAGCEFQATWHKTHCCNGCAAGKDHGPKCERLEKQPAPTQEPQKEAEEFNVQVDDSKRKEEVAEVQVQESPA